MINYFELYQLPVGFHPDKEAVKKKFYALSKLYHPDRFTLSDENAQQEALQMAALNNAAYKTFQDDDATLRYVLQLKGVLEEEEKYSLPPMFLMEMMDLNEAVSEYEMEPSEGNKEKAVGNWQEQMNALQKELNALTLSAVTVDDEKILARVKDFYFRKKYLLRIQERLDTFAAR